LIDPTLHTTPEPIGKRIARLRAERGWTQQALSQRLGVSRVAISHMEMDLTIPSERTITLLAGVFKITPHELVEGTTYPLAKAEKLPLTTCSYTSLELDLALLENDLSWLKRLEGEGNWASHAYMVKEHWQPRLAQWSNQNLDPVERDLLQQALQKLHALSSWIEASDLRRSSQVRPTHGG
jgi:transcriptional regulator with XRE-family HTH domain